MIKRKNKNIIFKHPFRTRYYLLHPQTWVKEVWCHHKWAFQRIKYGYSDADLYDLDHYFTRTISWALRDYVEQAKHIVNDEGKYFNDAIEVAATLMAVEQLEDDCLYVDNMAQIAEECEKARLEALTTLSQIWNYLWW